MSILSNWKLTYKPGITGETVVVAHDDELMEEPEIGPTVGYRVIPIRYGTPILDLDGSKVYDLSVTLIKYSATDAEARRDMMRAVIVQYDPLGKVPLRLEIRGLATERYDFTSAVFGRPRVRRLEAWGEDGKAAWSLALPITAVGASRSFVTP